LQAVLSEYLPAGQESTQLELSINLGEVQVRQSLAVAAEQVPQVVSQVVQVLLSGNFPSGQVSTQAKPSNNLGEEQLKQLLASPPEHVAQELSQVLQSAPS
jgi:hypothetical protein